MCYYKVNFKSVCECVSVNVRRFIRPPLSPADARPVWRFLSWKASEFDYRSTKPKHSSPTNTEHLKHFQLHYTHTHTVFLLNASVRHTRADSKLFISVNGMFSNLNFMNNKTRLKWSAKQSADGVCGRSGWIYINHEWQSEITWSLARGPAANQMPGSFPPWFPLATATWSMWEILSSHENTHTITGCQRASQRVMKRRTLKISRSSVLIRSWCGLVQKESCGSVDSSLKLWLPLKDGQILFHQNLQTPASSVLRALILSKMQFYYYFVLQITHFNG